MYPFAGFAVGLALCALFKDKSIRGGICMALFVDFGLVHVYVEE